MRLLFLYMRCTQGAPQYKACGVPKWRQYSKHELHQGGASARSMRCTGACSSPRRMLKYLSHIYLSLPLLNTTKCRLSERAIAYYNPIFSVFQLVSLHTSLRLLIPSPHVEISLSHIYLSLYSVAR